MRKGSQTLADDSAYSVDMFVDRSVRSAILYYLRTMCRIHIPVGHGQVCQTAVKCARDYVAPVILVPRASYLCNPY